MSDPSAPPPAFGEVPPPPRWLARRSSRQLVGRLVVACVAGIITGIAVANSLADDRREGAALTKEKYLSEYETHKQKLVASEGSIPEDVLIGVVMLLVVAALYEAGGILVAPAVARLDDTLARRDAARRRLVRDDTDV